MQYTRKAATGKLENRSDKKEMCIPPKKYNLICPLLLSILDYRPQTETNRCHNQKSTQVRLKTSFTPAPKLGWIRPETYLLRFSLLTRLNGEIKAGSQCRLACLPQ